MRKLLGLSIIAAGITLAVIIGQRMSTDAMAVAIGVVFGVAASIPTSLLIVAATRGRRDEGRYRQPDFTPPPMQAPQPQIYIVSPNGATGQQAPWLTGGMQAQLPMPPGSYYTPEQSRRYKVVGEDEHWLDYED